MYLGRLTAERDGLQSYVIFIVRDERRADFLFQCSDKTWQAYNRWPSQFAVYDNGNTRGTFTATIYPGPKGNFVFNASSCWWADGLSAPPGYVRPAVYAKPRGPDARAQRITANVLE